MTVRELSREELIELKENYMIKLSDENRYAERFGVDWNTPSYGELYKADDLVSDDEVFDEYGGVDFTSEDFYCNSPVRGNAR